MLGVPFILPTIPQCYPKTRSLEVSRRRVTRMAPGGKIHPQNMPPVGRFHTVLCPTSCRSMCKIRSREHGFQCNIATEFDAANAQKSGKVDIAMDMLGALILGFLLLTVAPVNAAEPAAFQTLWDALARDPDCKPSQFPDFILVTCERERTFWYFTKPNHPAYPGIVKRYLVEKDGAWYAQEEGHSFAADAAQPAFKLWLAQIADLDRQAQESIQKRRSQNPAGQ
ncbi:MAG TPA: hypothetical protein VHW02_11460 [Rhizomicrobium sp.]|nr:hypothetical protein [Rhizomicrobium sp.]